LPVEEVVWVVLGMALFRDRPIEDIVSKLELALPGAGTVARSSGAQARARLGSEPMKWLFERSASTWAIVALMVLRSHLLAGARFGPYGGTSELEPAKELRAVIPDDSLTVLDRRFLAAPMLLGIGAGGRNRHWLTRAKSNSKWRVLARLGKGDELVEMDVSSEARRNDPSLPRTWTMRAIRYQRKGFRPQTLLASRLDTNQYPGGWSSKSKCEGDDEAAG
jgi:hypothetical protein